MTPGDDLARHLAPVPLCDPGSGLPEGWWHGPFMQVFVRAFQDSDGDGIGDLKGLAARLDDLQDLGVRGLWLMPVTPAADRDHGYATIDYRAIEADYGTMDDFDELLTEAHRRGIGIVLDYVANHCSVAHPLFEASAGAPHSPWRDWFLWTSPRPQDWDVHGHDPWIASGDEAYFASFDARMPDFNLRRDDVVAFHLANLRFWLNRGVDGFRLDAVPHFIKNGPHDWKDQPESRRLTRRLCDEVRRYRNRFVVCESTAKPWVYSTPAVCGSAFAFGFNKLVLRATAGAVEAVRELADLALLAPPTLATMMSNHDRVTGRRLWDETAGDLERYRLAAATYLLLPGIPFVYYGEPVGMSGAPGLTPDDSLRAPMSWAAPGEPGGFTSGRPFRAPAENAARQNAAAESRSEGSLLGFYRRLLRLRGSLPALARGVCEDAWTCGPALVVQRRHAGERVLVALNYGAAAQVLTIDTLAPGTVFEGLAVWDERAAAVPRRRGDAFEVTLPGRRAIAYRLAEAR